MVVGGRHLHHVHRHEVDIRQLADDRGRLVVGETAGNRRARAGSNGGIEAVDVEGEVGLVAAHHLADDVGQLRRCRLMHLVGIDDLEAIGALAGEHRADADLNRLLGVYQPFLHRVAKHGAVVDATAVIGFNVAVRIEVDERQGAVLLGMCPEQRIGDVVVPTQRDHLGAG